MLCSFVGKYLLADEERTFFLLKKKMLDANKVRSHRHANNNEKKGYFLQIMPIDSHFFGLNNEQYKM